LRLLRKFERRKSESFTLQLNMSEFGYSTMSEHEYFWPEGIYWRDWDLTFKNKRFQGRVTDNHDNWDDY